MSNGKVAEVGQLPPLPIPERLLEDVVVEDRGEGSSQLGGSRGLQGESSGSRGNSGSRSPTRGRSEIADTQVSDPRRRGIAPQSVPPPSLISPNKSKLSKKRDPYEEGTYLPSSNQLDSD